MGTYGTIRPADVDPKDVEIFYNYAETKNQQLTDTWNTLVSTDVLIRTKEPNASSVSELMGGIYTLKLPTSIFNTKGFYYIYIRPRQIRTTIKDNGVLYSDSNIRGIVVDPADGFTNDSKAVNVNNNLIGYRIEYISTDTNTKLSNQYTVITSSNKAEAINSGGENSSDILTSYNLVSSGNLIFLTVTPSSANSSNPNYLPFIGAINQQIIISNTFFNPEMIEVEVVEHDIDTLSWQVGGNRVMDIAGSKVTIYNDNDEIYKQTKIYKKQNASSGDIDYEISENLTDIDTTQNFNTIKNL